MTKTIAILISWGFSTLALAQPIITPTNFLDTQEPVRMCQNYISEQYGEITAFTQPSCGALLRIADGDLDRCVYIFCDAPSQRLLIYALNDGPGGRIPFSVKAYGKEILESFWVFGGDENTDSVLAPIARRDYEECFNRPVDATVSAHDRYFDRENDRIYVLDGANRRVVKLMYKFESDSLSWVSSFGDNLLRAPTAIDYADYGTPNYDDDDIYVTDAGLSRVLRFSAQGVFETSYGGWGRGLGSMSNPTGVAVSAATSLVDRIYVTDSHNHRVVRYRTSTNGPIMAECQYVFPLNPQPLIGGVDTDAEGFVYVVNSFANTITALKSDLDEVSLVYGSLGYEPGQFDYPTDIYIDGDEMQVCELWAELSGIQSFSIQSGAPKIASGQLPYQFQLFQNYPNPFNSNTTIMFELPQSGAITLDIFNILGQRIKVLVRNEMPAGRHGIIWDGKNQAGRAVSSGVYFSVLRQKKNVMVKKLLLLK